MKTPSLGNLIGVASIICTVISPCFAVEVKTFRIFEVSLTAASPGTKPFLNGPEVTATFSGTSGLATGKAYTVRGFWDGGNVWRIRFAPTAPGNWSYSTSSSDSGLNGETGMLTAVAPTNAEICKNVLFHGFLERDSTHAWRLSDGTPFLPVGDTQWSFSEEFDTSDWKTWMIARQEQHFNTFLGTIWLGQHSCVEQAFQDGIPTNGNLNLAYFRDLDQRVVDANDRGIMMGLMVGGFPCNGDWWERFQTRSNNDGWFRYCVARYAAYNVRWVLYGEVNEISPSWGSWQDQVSHDLTLILAEDPYHHPIGSHAAGTGVDTSSVADSRIGYVEVQADRDSETQYQNAQDYAIYGKPVWFEEYWYEPNCYGGDVTRGIRNTHRNFVAALAFPTFGSLMRAHCCCAPDECCTWVSSCDGSCSCSTEDSCPNVSSAASDAGAKRMGHFARFYSDLDMRNFAPCPPGLVNRGQCGRFGNSFVIFLKGGGSVTLNLKGIAGTLSVARLKIDSDSWDAASLPSVAGGGSRTINSGVSVDVVLRLDPPPTVVHVDLSSNGCENGTGACPFQTVAAGSLAAMNNATLAIVPGIYPESLTLRRPLRLEKLSSVCGIVRIGDSSTDLSAP